MSVSGATVRQMKFDQRKEPRQTQMQSAASDVAAGMVSMLARSGRKRKEARAANKRMERIDSQMADVMLRVC